MVKHTEHKTEKSLKEQYMESQKNAFFREVEEDVKAEKISLIWNKYKTYIISIIVIILSITIAKNWYNNYKAKVSLEQAKKFERIISATNVTNEGKILELTEFAKNAKFGYKDIAYLNIYSMQIETGKYEDAINSLNTLIDDATDDTFKNIAIIKLATLSSSIPTKDLQKVKEELERISSRKPFYPVAQFTLGTIYVKQNELAKAKEIFEELTNSTNIPVSLKAQSLSVLNYIKSAEGK